MRVLVFHGYLLRGTGSNVYNASLVRALAALGHEVHLLCQDRATDPIPGIESEPGSVRIHRPDIGGLLPVYVRDEYEGFEVKTFAELTEAELDRYLEANVAAVRNVMDAVGAFDAALANHLVMGPAILARAGLRFAATVHGSALEYTVKPQPERFLPYAREGMEAASGVLVGSRHTAESLWDAVGVPGLPEKTRLGPPGVDTTLFSPLGDESASDRLRGLADSFWAGGESGGWDRSPERAADAVEHFAAAEGPRVVLVGKMIVSKGIDLLLAAWPLVVEANPGARLLIVGFGEYEHGLLDLWRAIESGDLGAAREIAKRGRRLEGGPRGPLRMLLSLLDDPPERYRAAGSAAAGSVAFAGRLEHAEVGRLVPACDVLVFPSTFPEAFGMVAAEAAAAGVGPVSADHSGAAEVSRALAANLPSQATGLVSFPLGDRAVLSLAERINGWLGLDAEVAAEARRQLRETASRLWSWEGVARGVLAASAGELAELPRVPDD